MRFVIAVISLARFAGMKVDREPTPKQITRSQELIDQRQHCRMLDEGRDRGRLRKQRVDPLRELTFEWIASEGSQMRLELVTDPRDFGL